MKTQIILPKPEQSLVLDNTIILPITSYYGYQICQQKGVITRQNNDEGKFITQSISNLTNGNKYPDFTSDTLISLIEKLLQCKACEGVFMFSNKKELCKWLAE